MVARLVRVAILARAGTLAFTPAVADAQRTPRPRVERPEPPRRDQDAAFQNRQSGRAMPLRVLERRVMMQMRDADYMGNPIYFEERNTYRMTFMRGGRVIRVEVDARSGHITDRTDR